VAKLNHWWQQVKLPVAVGLLVIVAGFLGAQWQQRIDSEERSVLIDRFPKARAAAAASATEAADAKYAAQIKGLEGENAALRSSQALIAKSVADTHEIAAYTLRFLGDRARVTDARQATLIKKANEAALAATAAAQKTEVVEQKINVATAAATAAASTAKAVDKKLETAVQPPQPAQPWIGNRR
jgi:hypothetical protein